MNPLLQSFALRTWQYIAVLTAALWIGGFTFHTSVTLRVGGGIIGGLEQGYVTQAALGKLHWFAVAMIVAAVIDALIRFKTTAMKLCIVRGIGIQIMSVCVIALFRIHADMSAMMDPDAMTQPDKAAFAPLHERYQTCATILWLCAMVELGMMIRAQAIQAPGMQRTEGKTEP